MNYGDMYIVPSPLLSIPSDEGYSEDVVSRGKFLWFLREIRSWVCRLKLLHNMNVVRICVTHDILWCSRARSEPPGSMLCRRNRQGHNAV